MNCLYQMFILLKKKKSRLMFFFLSKGVCQRFNFNILKNNNNLIDNK